LTREHLKKI